MLVVPKLHVVASTLVNIQFVSLAHSVYKTFHISLEFIQHSINISKWFSIMTTSSMERKSPRLPQSHICMIKKSHYYLYRHTKYFLLKIIKYKNKIINNISYQYLHRHFQEEWECMYHCSSLFLHKYSLLSQQLDVTTKKKMCNPRDRPVDFLPALG